MGNTIAIIFANLLPFHVMNKFLMEWEFYILGRMEKILCLAIHRGCQTSFAEADNICSRNRKRVEYEFARY